MASIGNYSGPAGTVALPLLHGAQIWVASVNQRGGIDGHRVQLIVYDDGSDPARHRAQTQEAVEQRKVVAFLQEAAPLTHASAVDYLDSKRIPTIGTDLSSPWDYGSQMHFPQATGGSYSFALVIFGAAQQLLPAGKKNLGIVVCTEAQQCADAQRIVTKVAKDAGFEVVYQAKASLAQPDFTAECLGARNARADLLFIQLDPNSIGRFAASCARQSYRPNYTAIPPAISAHATEDPNLSTLIGATNVFPFFQTGTPALDEFRQAVKAFARDGVRGWPTAAGWVSGKLFERAAADIPEPPTTEALLRGPLVDQERRSWWPDLAAVVHRSGAGRSGHVLVEHRHPRRGVVHPRRVQTAVPPRAGALATPFLYTTADPVGLAWQARRRPRASRREPGRVPRPPRASHGPHRGEIVGSLDHDEITGPAGTLAAAHGGPAVSTSAGRRP